MAARISERNEMLVRSEIEVTNTNVYNSCNKKAIELVSISNSSFKKLILFIMATVKAQLVHYRTKSRFYSSWLL